MKGLSSIVQGRKQNASKKTPKKQQVTMPKRRSSRMKKSVQVFLSCRFGFNHYGV